MDALEIIRTILLAPFMLIYLGFAPGNEEFAFRVVHNLVPSFYLMAVAVFAGRHWVWSNRRTILTGILLTPLCYEIYWYFVEGYIHWAIFFRVPPVMFAAFIWGLIFCWRWPRKQPE
jgi:hypothetical protein